jgi:hypothetical protein
MISAVKMTMPISLASLSASGSTGTSKARMHAYASLNELSGLPLIQSPVAYIRVKSVVCAKIKFPINLQLCCCTDSVCSDMTVE